MLLLSHLGYTPLGGYTVETSIQTLQCCFFYFFLEIKQKKETLMFLMHAKTLGNIEL